MSDDKQPSNWQQAIAGENGSSLIKGLVNRRLAATKIVIVHSGKIIVNQRIAMNQFNGAGSAQGRLFRHTEKTRGLNRQEWPQPLPTAQNGMPHGVDQPTFGGIIC